MAKGAASRRQQVFTGVAAVLILALAFWLLLGRSPNGPPERVEVALGTAVETDAGTITVQSLDPVAPGTLHTPAPEPSHEVRAIRFRACRPNANVQLVDLSLFSVRNADGTTAPAASSSLSDATGACTSGQVFVQVPDASTPQDVEYAAAPVAVWRLSGGE